MRFYRQINQYWPLTVIAGVVVLGIPLLGIKSDLTGSAGGKPVQDFNSGNKDINYKTSGYVKSAGEQQMFGFEDALLHDGKADAKLSEFKANTILVEQLWKNNQGLKEKNFSELTALRKDGVKVIVQVTEMADWVNVESATSIQAHSFTLARAARALSQAKRAGLEKVADMIVLGGANEDVPFYANYMQRKKMYELAKQYFPNTPIIQRYGAVIEKPEGLSGQAHPVGGIWNEYQFGADECDLAMISLKHSSAIAVDQLVENLNQQITLVKSRHSEGGILVSVQGSSDSISQKDLELLGAALIHSASVDGLIFKGMNQFPKAALLRLAPGKNQPVKEARLPASVVEEASVGE